MEKTKSTSKATPKKEGSATSSSDGSLSTTQTKVVGFQGNSSSKKEDCTEETNDTSDLEDQNQKKPNFFSKDAGQMRKKYFKTYPIVVLILCSYFLTVFSIYWGSLYQRNKRLVNLNILVSVEDDPTGFVSESLIAATNLSDVKQLAGWQVHGYVEPDKVKDLVHKQKYWGAVYVSANNISTLFAKDLATNGTFQFNYTTNGYYETGRDILGIPTYVRPAISALGVAFEEILRAKVYPELLSHLNNTQYLSVRENPSLASIPTMSFTDGSPFTEPILQAPMQIGLIYIMIVCFFQTLFFLRINIEMATRVSPLSYIFCRIVAPQVCYFFMALIYACLNLAFKVNFNKKWDHGFAIFWLLSYLIMSACGGACENAATALGSIAPPLIGFWMLFFVCINISATYAPIQICPKIYRFTYAMPIRTGYEIMGILFMNASSHKLGLYIGILVCWIVINSLLLPFCLMFAGYMLKKKKQGSPL